MMFITFITPNEVPSPCHPRLKVCTEHGQWHIAAVYEQRSVAESVSLKSVVWSFWRVCSGMLLRRMWAESLRSLMNAGKTHVL